MWLFAETFTFASNQCPQVPKHFEIHGKRFAVQAKTMKTVKVLALEHFVLYSTMTISGWGAGGFPRIELGPEPSPLTFWCRKWHTEGCLPLSLPASSTGSFSWPLAAQSILALWNSLWPSISKERGCSDSKNRVPTIFRVVCHLDMLLVHLHRIWTFIQ